VTIRVSHFAWLGFLVSMALLVPASCGAAFAASVPSAPPTVLVFDSVVGQGASKDLAATATIAVRTYFRETHRVEAVVLNVESPTVARAVLEKKLTLDSITSDTSREHRVQIAKTLGFDYAAAAEVSVAKDAEHAPGIEMPKLPRGVKPAEEDKDKPKPKADYLQVKVWLNKVDGAKRDQWDTSQATILTGTRDIDRENSVQGVVSAAILDLTQKAFAKVAPVEPTTLPEQTTAVSEPELPTGKAPTAADYVSRADDNVSMGNLALAIDQYSKAVSADPSDGKLRIKLAEAYAKKGLYDQAKDELDRALLVGVDKSIVDTSRQKILRMQVGKPADTPAPKAVGDAPPVTKPAPPPPPTTPGPANTNNASTDTPTVTKDAAKQAVQRLIQGDKLWNDGKPDDAALAYTEATKLNPNDARSYERLAAVNASMSLFGEARKSIEKVNALQPKPPADVVSRRYEMFRKAFESAFGILLKQLDSDTADYEKNVINRESYYESVNGLGIRLDSMAKFLDVLAVPPAKQPASLRRGLACGLLAQACACILDYLETNKKKSKDSADAFIAQGRKESEMAATLDANKIIIKKDEDTTPAPKTTAKIGGETPTQPDNQSQTQPDNQPGGSDDSTAPPPDDGSGMDQGEDTGPQPP